MGLLLSFEVVQPRRGTPPTAQVQPLGDRFHRQRRFPAQPGRQFQFLRGAPGPLFQVRSRPTQPLQFSGNDALGFGLRSLDS